MEISVAMEIIYYLLQVLSPLLGFQSSNFLENETQMYEARQYYINLEKRARKVSKAHCRCGRTKWEHIYYLSYFTEFIPTFLPS